VCEIQPEDPSILSAVTAQGITFDSASGVTTTSKALLHADVLSSRLYVRHFDDDRLLGSTVLVLESKDNSLSIIANLFVRDLDGRGANIVTSSFSLQDTIVNRLLMPMDTEILSAFIDFDGEVSSVQGGVGMDDAIRIATGNKVVVILVMLMDKQQGLVCRGVLEARMDTKSYLLSAVGQTWSEMWRFREQGYYMTFAVSSHFCIVAYQFSDMALVAAELASNGTNINNTTSYYDLVKLDLLNGESKITRVARNRTFFDEALQPSFFAADGDGAIISLCDPSDGLEHGGKELTRVDLSTWEIVPPVAQSYLKVTAMCTSQHESKSRAPLHHEYISSKQFVQYRDIFEDAWVVFQDTDGFTFGIVRLHTIACGDGAWANRKSYFSCTCRPGYKPKAGVSLAEIAQGQRCQLCSPYEACSSSKDEGSNASKCMPGYKINDQNAQCVMCGADEYCYHSRGHMCPTFSGTNQLHGAVQLSACVCKSGFHYDSVMQVCQECTRPFYCADSHKHRCPGNMSTEVDRAENINACRCWSGFFDTTQFTLRATINNNLPAICHEAPLGSYVNASAILTQCPERQSTKNTQSTSVLQCVCAGGYKTTTDVQTGLQSCSPCGGEELCEIRSNGVVAACEPRYRQIVNANHDACVCQAGYYDELALQEGRMRCAPCPAAFFCPQERIPKIQPTIVPCPHKTTSHPGTSSVSGCFCRQSDRNLMSRPVPPFDLQCLCARTHYESMESVCTACPSNMLVSARSMFAGVPFVPRESACTCVAGFYKTDRTVLAGDFKGDTCVLCPKGYFCPASQDNALPFPCPEGTFGPSPGQRSDRGCLACPSHGQHTTTRVGVNSTLTTQLSNTSRVANSISMALPSRAQSLQGSVLDCFVEFTPVYYSRELDFDTSSFVFVVYSNQVKTIEIQKIVQRIFNLQLESIEAVSGFNRIQYSIQLTPTLSSSILLVLSQMNDHWAVIRAETAKNLDFYTTMIRYVFCDVMERIAMDVHSVEFDVALCYLPMDAFSILGNKSVFLFASLGGVTLCDYISSKTCFHTLAAMFFCTLMNPCLCLHRRHSQHIQHKCDDLYEIKEKNCDRHIVGVQDHDVFATQGKCQNCTGPQHTRVL